MSLPVHLFAKLSTLGHDRRNGGRSAEARAKMAETNRDTRGRRQDNIGLAVGAILFTVFALSLGDALIKRISTGFVLWQIFVLRSLLALPVLLGIIHLSGARARMIPEQLGWAVVRSLMLVLMWISYYASLPHLPLSIAAAAYYTLPMFITLFSALIVGEPVRRLAWIAVAIGFAGVLLILRPKATEFNAYALLPLVSAMLYALAMILTRTKCREEHPLALSLFLNLAFVIVGSVATLVITGLGFSDEGSFLRSRWIPMEREEWTAMLLLAGAILVGSIGTALAYQSGPSSVVGTFDFAYVGFAVIWGYIFFGEAPDVLSTLGMAMIVLSGILSTRR